MVVVAAPGKASCPSSRLRRMGSHEAHVAASVRLVLQTARGERVMRPDFGSGVRTLAFAPLTVATAAVLTQTIREALVAGKPRIDLLDVQITLNPAARRLGSAGAPGPLSSATEPAPPFAAAGPASARQTETPPAGCCPGWRAGRHPIPVPRPDNVDFNVWHPDHPLVPPSNPPS